MSRVGKSYKKTVELRRGDTSDVNGDTLVTLTNPSTTEDYTVDRENFSVSFRVRKETNVTSTYQILSSDDLIRCDGTFTVTLPDATTIEGRQIDIKNIGTGVITVNTLNSQTIDGNLTDTLSTKDSLSIYANESGDFDIL